MPLVPFGVEPFMHVIPVGYGFRSRGIKQNDNRIQTTTRVVAYTLAGNSQQQQTDIGLDFFSSSKKYKKCQ